MDSVEAFRKHQPCACGVAAMSGTRLIDRWCAFAKPRPLPHTMQQIFALLGIHEFFPSASFVSFLEGVLCM